MFRDGCHERTSARADGGNARRDCRPDQSEQGTARQADRAHSDLESGFFHRFRPPWIAILPKERRTAPSRLAVLGVSPRLVHREHREHRVVQGAEPRLALPGCRERIHCLRDFHMSTHEPFGLIGGLRHALRVPLEQARVVLDAVCHRYSVTLSGDVRVDGEPGLSSPARKAHCELPLPVHTAPRPRQLRRTSLQFRLLEQFPEFRPTETVGE